MLVLGWELCCDYGEKSQAMFDYGYGLCCRCRIRGEEGGERAGVLGGGGGCTTGGNKERRRGEKREKNEGEKKEKIRVFGG